MTYLVTVRAGLLLQVFEGGLQALEFTFTQVAQVVTDSVGSYLVKLTGTCTATQHTRLSHVQIERQLRHILL